MKRIIGTCLYFCSLSVFACEKALPTSDVNFCPSFKAAAVCYCTSAGMPSGICQDMKTLYRFLIGAFGSLKKACEYQHHTSTQDCIDNWNCYRLGGTDSQGRICSSTYAACE